MLKLKIFDPALCCSSGVCDADADPQLASFAADVDWARKHGACIERFNLAQQPLVFASHSVIKDLLERTGESALPVALLGDDLVLAGRYPSRTELAKWFGLDVNAAPQGCCGSCC